VDFSFSSGLEIGMMGVRVYFTAFHEVFPLGFLEEESMEDYFQPNRCRKEKKYDGV
jgi:hypothetical protein